MVGVGIATRLDIDRIDDLGIAIEEAAETLAALDGADDITVTIHDDGAALRCELTITGSKRLEPIEMDDLRTRVLETATDSIEIEDSPPRVVLTIAQPT